MAGKVQTLFDDSRFEKRKVPEQAEFERKHGAFMLAVQDLFTDAHQQLHSKIFVHFKPNEMDKNLPAVSMISFMKQSLIRNYPSYCWKATRSRFVLVTPTGENIYIKKLDDKKRPNNISTINNDIILLNVTIDEKDNEPNIFIGYTTTDTYSEITGVYAVCILGNKINWITDVSTLDNGEQADLMSVEPKGIPPTLKPGTVTIKTGTKRE